jgi:hypothetical protein
MLLPDGHTRRKTTWGNPLKKRAKSADFRLKSHCNGRQRHLNT